MRATAYRAGCLAERGWRVVSTEYRTRNRGWVAVNLDHDLPFRSASFELVMMLEVIEHLADIPHILGEIARVMRPGAVAIVTTPNRLNVSSRIHYLLSGYYKGRRAPLAYKISRRRRAQLARDGAQRPALDRVGCRSSDGRDWAQPAQAAVANPRADSMAVDRGLLVDTLRARERSGAAQNQSRAARLHDQREPADG